MEPRPLVYTVPTDPMVLLLYTDETSIQRFFFHRMSFSSNRLPLIWNEWYTRRRPLSPSRWPRAGGRLLQHCALLRYEEDRSPMTRRATDRPRGSQNPEARAGGPAVTRVQSGSETRTETDGRRRRRTDRGRQGQRHAPAATAGVSTSRSGVGARGPPRSTGSGSEKEGRVVWGMRAAGCALHLDPGMPPARPVPATRVPPPRSKYLLFLRSTQPAVPRACCPAGAVCRAAKISIFSVQSY